MEVSRAYTENAGRKNSSIPALPYGRQWVDDDDIKAVVECLRDDWLTQGPRVELFENALCVATGAKHAVAVSSGTAALHLAALATGVGSGDTAVTSANTFVASANCVAYCGGTPHFADVDPSTGLIDITSLELKVAELARLGNPPKLIVPVDFGGQAADLPRVRAIAGRCGAKVVEDAAHSFGGSYSHAGRSYRVGSCEHSDIAILSFHPVKHITTGEGGAVLTNDDATANRVRELRTHGIHRDATRLTMPDEGAWYYEQTELGYQYRLTDLQCALGLSQLSRLERFVCRRNEIADAYDAAFAKEPLLGFAEPLQTRRETVTHAYHLYVIRLKPRSDEIIPRIAARRKALYLAMRSRNIFVQVHYIPVPWQPYFQNRGEQSRHYPGASSYYAGCLSLPMYPLMTKEDVGRVIEALQRVASIGSEGHT